MELLKKDEEFRLAVAGLIGLEGILKRLEKHDEKFNEVIRRLDRHEEIFKEHNVKFNEILERLDRHEEILERHEKEMIRLREDMNKGFELVNRHISALGARWGLMAEEAFREGMMGLSRRSSASRSRDGRATMRKASSTAIPA